MCKGLGFWFRGFGFWGLGLMGFQVYRVGLGGSVF